MAKDYAHGYASIVKYDKNDDGTLMVFGKATDDSLDLDSQICDPAWLDMAMPAWFKSGGNIREMHGPSAAGVAKEYEAKSDGHYISVHVVDPIAVKKVENRVYQGFSIGIKSPRVVRDSKAANGRIIDGQIIEVSLVDRPANPSAKLILAKAIEGESSLVQVEELHEYKAPLPSEVANMTAKGSKMETIEKITELAKSLTPNAVKFDQTLFDNARRALAELIALEAAEMTEGHDERASLAHLVGAVHALMNWYEGEEAEGEVPMENEENESIELAAAGDDTGDTRREEAVGEKMCKMCDKAADECACEAKEADADEEEEVEKTAEADVAVEDAPVADAPVVEDSEDKTSDSEDVKALVEKAVMSAMESVRAEIDTLRAEKESAVEKSVKLEAELTTALSKTVAGGPKRTATTYGAESNEYLVKALTYKAKADATTDPVLRKGYSDLYEEFNAKAFPAQNK